MEDRRTVGKGSDQRIGTAGCGRTHLMPAEFDRPAEDVPGAVTAGDKLGTEANAEDGLVGRSEIPGQCGNGGEPRAVMVIEGALAAAEDDQGIMAIVAWGYGIALKCAAERDLGTGFGERRLDLAKRRAGEILQDKHTHPRFRGNVLRGD